MPRPSPGRRLAGAVAPGCNDTGGDHAAHCGRELLARRIVPAGPIVPETTAEDILGADWRGGPSIETSARRHAWWTAGAVVVTAAVAGGVLIARRRPGAARRG